MRRHPDRSRPVESSRRDFLKWSGTLAASATAIPTAHAGEDNTIRLALIGCGNRGSGAVANALSAPGGPVKLHAMADLFEDKQALSYDSLRDRFGDKVDVPADRKFLGFDAYRKAIDTLRPGDVALLTTHAYCRPTHLDYAVKKGVNVFMEKSFAPAPGGLQQMLRAGKAAEEKGLKVAAGLMCRHSPNRQAMIEKVRSGELGEIPLIRAYRLSGARWLGRRNAEADELEWQIRHAPHFFWASSGFFIEWLIHQIDECCWLKDAWPVAAHGMGGRVVNSRDHGQDLDTYAVEYTFPDGARATVDGRSVNGCHNEFATYLHGTKRAGQFSGKVHRGTVRTYEGHRVDADAVAWSAPEEKASPWQYEWNVLLENIRKDRPQNEVRRAVYADFAAKMGRAAFHSGEAITWDGIRSSDFRFSDYADEMGFDSEAPVHDDEAGRYPVPVPAEWSEV